MVIVLPGMLPPDAPNYTVSASPNEIRVKAGREEIARFPYHNPEVFQFLSKSNQVGIVEYPSNDVFPNEITAVAYVETWRAA